MVRPIAFKMKNVYKSISLITDKVFLRACVAVALYMKKIIPFWTYAFFLSYNHMMSSKLFFEKETRKIAVQNNILYHLILVGIFFRQIP